MCDYQAIAGWIAELDCPDRDQREVAKTHLLAAGSHAVEPLITAMKTGTKRQCYEAAHILAQIDDERWVVPMQEALTSPNVLLAEAAAIALERYGQRSIEGYLRALPNSHPIVQLRIVSALERIGDRRAVIPLIALLSVAASPSLRCAIIQALGILGDSQAAALIRSFENDADHHVRERVAIALQRLATS